MSRRRHEEHAAYERRRKRTTFIFSLFVVLTMVGAIFAAMLYNPTTQERMEYGDHEFALKELASGGSVYTLELNGNEIEIQHLPPYVTYLEVDSGVAPLLANAQQLALVADSAAPIEDLQLIDYARFQIALALPTQSYSGMTAANQYGLPVVNCSVASPQMPVLLFVARNDTPRIELNGSCIIASGTGRGILAAKDRLLYERYGLIAGGQVLED